MKTITFAFCIAFVSTSALAAGDISMCLSSGYSAKCCQKSLAKFGPFGQAYGDSKAQRLSQLEACKAAEAKRKR